MKIVRFLIEKYGIPEAIYTDNDSIFKYIRSDEQLHVIYHKDQQNVSTQFQPEAKGKIERFFRFLQDRFVNELKRYVDKIPKDTFGAIKFANKILYRFLNKWRNSHIHAITQLNPLIDIHHLYLSQYHLRLI